MVVSEPIPDPAPNPAAAGQPPQPAAAPDTVAAAGTPADSKPPEPEEPPTLSGDEIARIVPEAGNRRAVELEEVPSVVRNAVLAAEDRRQRYRLTPAGRRQLEAQIAAMEPIVQAATRRLKLT